MSAHLPEDEELWERALTELEGRNRRAGLWARAFAESGGDAAAAKAAYLRLRVAQLARERAVAGAPGVRRASWSGDRVLEPDRR